MRNLAGVGFCLLLCAASPTPAGWSFADATGVLTPFYFHGYLSSPTSEPPMIGGGAAAADYDGDGWYDLYVVRGDIGPNLLFRNANGSFVDVAAAAEVDAAPLPGCGPTFADIDGDGRLDLAVGSIGDGAPAIYRNVGLGRFEDHSTVAGLDDHYTQFSSAFADYDGDSDLDMVVAYWTGGQPYVLPESGAGDDPPPRRLSLWRNDGSGRFELVSDEAGLGGVTSFAFTPNFADVTGDGWPDLLVAADFGTSLVAHNNRDGTFTIVDDPAITDENGMGAAVGDYDGDGRLDWFVTSIFDDDGTPEGNWGTTGNRLYRNLGDGSFEDATELAGVREGGWGWGSCFADFNNDGQIDIFHVNGFPIPSAAQFFMDPSRLFVSDGDGSFTERSAELGLVDTGQGRGVVCFDYDLDGDIDIFVANNSQPPKLFRNDGGNALAWLTVELDGHAPNTRGIGARVEVVAGGATQIREIRAGNNFASSNPSVAHFGLGSATTADLDVYWPSGIVTSLDGVAVDQRLVVGEGVAAPAGSVDTMQVGKPQPTGDTLALDWTGCAGTFDHLLLWGDASAFPTGSESRLDPTDGLCSIGPSTSYSWAAPPAAELLWWIVVPLNDEGVEGSWGRDGRGLERRGPAPGGASGLCAGSGKVVLDRCD